MSTQRALSAAPSTLLVKAAVSPTSKGRSAGVSSASKRARAMSNDVELGRSALMKRRVYTIAAKNSGLSCDGAQTGVQF
jgi:hypothetical protein